MTAINHITGGAAFTAFFCSLHDVNIFEKPQLIAATIIFSLLPDIDHTKSTIGKVLYPLAKLLDNKYGHRTITHSLIFYLGACLFMWVFEFFFSVLNHFTIIFVYAYLSHLIFDSMTKQAIPLFYPFLKNPTCLPANPDLRFNTGNWKVEGVFFAAFVFMLAFCQPLYANGFWTTYNRTFATLTHLRNEFKKQENFLLCEFTYSKQGKIFEGKGYVAAADESQAQIFVPEKGYFAPNKDDCKNIKVLPEKTQQPYKIVELFYTYITSDSLQRMIKAKPIVKLHLVANTPISFYKDKKLQTSETVDLEYVYNPTLKFLQDSIKIFEYEESVEVLHEDISQEQKKQRVLAQTLAATQDSLVSLKTEYQTANMVRQTAIIREIEILKSHLRALQIEENRYIENYKPQIQAKNLHKKIARERQTKCSGYISYLKFE